jgi:transcription-repair coupling factor (superfamily II helicase)
VTAQAYQIPSVQKRLEVIQSLDYLGAGFALASHDMELRGAGNLVGKEQSGHIREVGTELYQQLLDEALEAVRSGEVAPTVENEVQINVGMPVMIPEAYVNSLSIRLQLYRRLGAVKTQAEIDTLAAEFVDRFGPLPDEVKNLLVIMTLKVMCRACSVQKLDAGPKGMVVTFAPQGAVDPLRLVAWVQKNPITRQIKPDQRLIIVEPWPDIQTRVAGIKRLLAEMTEAFGGEDHGVPH